MMDDFSQKFAQNLEGIPRLKWGSSAPVLFQANDQRRVRLVDVQLDVPQSVAVMCLPDPAGLVIWYWIRYGTGGCLRTSAALPAGTYICGGDQVYVDATYSQAPGTAVAAAAAWICSAAPTVP